MEPLLNQNLRGYSAFLLVLSEISFGYVDFEYNYKRRLSAINIIINPSTFHCQESVAFLVVDLTQALSMDFTTITSAHIWADYLTFEELRDRARVCRGTEGLANIPADLLGGHLITSDTGAALQI